jgi:hypothetical protein
MKKYPFIIGGLVVSTLFILDRWATKQQLERLERQHRIAIVEPSGPTNLARSASGRGPAVVESGRRGPSPTSVGEPAPVATGTETVEAPELPPPEDQVAYIDSVFGAQSYEGGWARDAARRLEDALTSIGGGASALSSVECRSSLCKAQIVHNDEAQFQRFLEQAFRAVSYWDGPRLSLRDEPGADGRVTSTMFFAKEGSEMPYLD